MIQMKRNWTADQIIHLNDNRVTIKTPIDKELLTGESKTETTECSHEQH